jgi:hypothetical protein
MTHSVVFLGLWIVLFISRYSWSTYFCFHVLLMQPNLALTLTLSISQISLTHSRSSRHCSLDQVRHCLVHSWTWEPCSRQASLNLVDTVVTNHPRQKSPTFIQVITHSLKIGNAQVSKSSWLKFFYRNHHWFHNATVVQ